MRVIDALELKRSIACSSILKDGKTLEQIIDEQPSAQPEIIRCKDCKHGMYDVMCKFYWCHGVAHSANWYCADSKRRTVRGEWIPINGANQWKCSNCGEYIGGDADCTPYINKFCWNCGADMKGVQNDLEYTTSY